MNRSLANAVSALRRSGPTLLCVHAVQTAWALLLLAPVREELSASVLPYFTEPSLTMADAARVLEAIVRRGPELLRWAPALLVVFALLAPALTVGWVHALGSAAGPVRALQRGVLCAPRALAVRLACLLGFCGAGAATLMLLALLLRVATPQLESMVRTLAVLLLAGSALAFATLHDLGLAALATRGCSAVSALRASVTLLQPRWLLARAASACAALCLVALADLCGRIAWPLHGLAAPLGPALATALGQVLLLASTASRGLWLALAVAASDLSLRRP